MAIINFELRYRTDCSLPTERRKKMKWTYKLPIMPLVDEAVTSMDDVLVADPITTTTTTTTTTNNNNINNPNSIIKVDSFDNNNGNNKNTKIREDTASSSVVTSNKNSKSKPSIVEQTILKLAFDTALAAEVMPHAPPHSFEPIKLHERC